MERFGGKLGWLRNGSNQVVFSMCQYVYLVGGASSPSHHMVVE